MRKLMAVGRSMVVVSAIISLAGSEPRAAESRGVSQRVSQRRPESATEAVLRAFRAHDLVLLGEMHGNRQQYEWLGELVVNAEFADQVDNVVMEFGNSRYQDVVDRYIRGDSVPLTDVELAWRNTGASVGPPSPVIASLYKAVRESNVRRRGKHPIRVLCGEPPLDWTVIRTRADLTARPNRDRYYARIVKDSVLAKHQRALLIMGSLHFVRNMVPGLSAIKRELRQAGARTFVLLSGTNVIGGYDDIDHRFDSWPTPSVVSLADDWVGNLPANSVLSGGERTIPSPLLKDAADALLYLGPRDSLTRLLFPRDELLGTPYGKEIERRMSVAGRSAADIAAALHSETGYEAPQFRRP